MKDYAIATPSPTAFFSVQQNLQTSKEGLYFASASQGEPVRVVGPSFHPLNG